MILTFITLSDILLQSLHCKSFTETDFELNGGNETSLAYIQI